MSAAGTLPPHDTITPPAGQVITGGVASFTVMVCVCEDELPQISVAVYVLATVNLLAHDPAVTTSLLVTVIVPLQLSVAITAVLLAAGTALAQLTVTFAGMLVITGAVWSLTVIV